MNYTLAQYRALFRSLIERNETALISNESRMHAAVIIQELIRSAKKSVHIQCTRLAEDVYGNPETEGVIRDALSRGVEFRVAVREQESKSKSLCQLLQAADPSSIRFHREVFDNDYCVVDGKRYRIETDPDAGTAVVCAYDTEMGGKLEKVFSIGYGAA